MLFSSILSPIFAGLITIFGVDTSFVRLILCSGAFGFRTGIGFNAPIRAVQTALATDDVSLGISIMLFAQHLGPSISIAIVQVIFTNQLSSNLAQIVPGLDPATIESQGLSDVVGQVSSAQHLTALEGAGKSFSETSYLAVGLTCATLIGSLLIEWRSVKQKGS
ncbi:Major Facilitator Superfamily [Aspergillus sclerotialis]|uniref:Major Facilitator Superfamily n=1 Tax=Aspergillus sclerotialis TaxID=2070753 RepID=A0A3A2ZDT5_9EURO|nr:Major Facilitator Superfamily [Aspergillus sclerotialis]